MEQQRGRIEPEVLTFEISAEPLPGGEGQRSGEGFGGRGRIPPTAVADRPDFEREKSEEESRKEPSVGDVLTFLNLWSVNSPAKDFEVIKERLKETAKRLFQGGSSEPQSARDLLGMLNDSIDATYLTDQGKTFLKTLGKVDWMREQAPIGDIPLEELGLDRGGIEIIFQASPEMLAEFFLLSKNDPRFTHHRFGIFLNSPLLIVIEGELMERFSHMLENNRLGIAFELDERFAQEWSEAVEQKYSL